MKVLLYLLYGGNRIYHLELTYSVLSALSFIEAGSDEIRIVLASDTANRRPDLPVEHLDVTPDMLHDWQFEGSYNHAAKPNALAYAIRHFDAPSVLIDSDTIFQRHPRDLFDRIGPGKTLLHAREGAFSQRLGQEEWRDFLAGSGGSLAGYPLDPHSVMYNSGIIGVDHRDVALLDDVVDVIRQIRTLSSIFTAEQFAASLVFSAKSELSAATDIVEHYWGWPRAYYHYQMRQMFPEVLAGGGLPALPATPPPLKHSPPVAMRLRLAAKLKTLQRKAKPEYAAAYLAYLSAMDCRVSDPDIANLWAGRALDMLQWGMRGQAPVMADFAGLAPAHLAHQHWLHPDLRSHWGDYWSRVGA